MQPLLFQNERNHSPEKKDTGKLVKSKDSGITNFNILTYFIALLKRCHVWIFIKIMLSANIGHEGASFFI